MSFAMVSVIGLGYIGLPTAVLLAQNGTSVIGIDINQHVVDSVNAGKLHIVEPELDSALKYVVEKSCLRATNMPEPADAFIIAVPTPFTTGHKPDVSYIEGAVKALAPVLKKGNLVILESTSPVGTTERLSTWLAAARPDLSFPQQAGDDADVQIAHCPERVLPGKVLRELVSNDRVVGGMSAKASKMATELYRVFVKGDIVTTTTRTAEMCKLTENSFRDVNIAFANELSIICDKLNIDVWELIRLANRHPRVNVLQPGCGVGGHCIAVDPWFIVDSVPNEARLIRNAREINDHKSEWVLEKIKRTITDILTQKHGSTLSDIKVACLGLAFKPDIDDLRESPAILIAQSIAKLGCQVLAVEPNIESLPEKLSRSNVALVQIEDALANADIICVLVKHSIFIKNKNITGHKHIIDTVGLIGGFMQ